MAIFKVNLKDNSYNIIVGKNILAHHLGKYLRSLKIGKDAYIITNAFLKKTYGNKIQEALGNAFLNFRFKLIPDTERSKSIDMVKEVLDDLSAFDKKRNVFIIAFGGGVAGDLAGFIASIYKRGIAYIQIPTTLLAQVDSSIGGKTAVDLAEAKNLIGSFYQPRLTFTDINFLRTLTQRQIRSGLAEVIKYGIIKDSRLFNYLEKKSKDILSLDEDCTEFLVERSIMIKASVISQDEKEKKGRRTILNFGHTLGHAIEAAFGYKKYNHGEAVSLGMLLASDISRRLRVLKPGVAERIEKLINTFGLPTKIKKAKISDIMNALYHDKKFSGPKNKFVLIRGLGHTLIVENISDDIIKEALRKRMF
jgi:3-dehydroquinate synthase